MHMIYVFLLDYLTLWWSNLYLYYRTFVSQIITGYLPSLILQSFLKTVPPIMECLSSIQGYISLSDIKKSACFKVLWFTIWNIFFATVFSGTALLQLSLAFEPKTIPRRLAVAVPAQVKLCVPMKIFFEAFTKHFLVWARNWYLITNKNWVQFVRLSHLYIFSIIKIYDSMKFGNSVFGYHICVYV